MPRRSAAVKTPTPSGGRQARTRLSRRAVIVAAADLFAAQGYAATTIEAVSERAEVPVATVYRLFGSKIGILKGWLDTSIGGDDEPVAVADRPPIAELATEQDPTRLIDGFVAVTAAINDRSHVVYRVLAGAALADPAAAELFSEIRRQRAIGQRGLTRALDSVAALRTGTNERQAADIVHAIMSPEVYAMLVVERRWSSARYRAWVSTTLTLQLLP